MSEKTLDEKAIFKVACSIDSTGARDEYLNHVCGDNPDLYERVVTLLRMHAEDPEFLESPALAVTAAMDHSITEQPGTEIGVYKLLQKIGEGGMGVVYMAEQTKPVERRVALKIIKLGMDSRQVIARFEAERQALALMDHPNIAKVLDAATTDSGRPYFVMELVKGVPLTTYCDEQHLTPRERLELFIPVCQAAQHAHQKGIIHRDLKPSNVLVALYDGRPVPKVIDFGVAKATTQKLTEKTMFTQYGQIVGTFEYMSPEQAQVNQLDIDTRSDIYSLGVLLYELLTGVTPFDRARLRSAAFDELMRIIREEEPPRPSMRLSTIDTLPSVAAKRRIEPQKLRTVVRGELDWIVMKALEKDRARRYETANGFAADIRRYLDDEPVVACPPSAGYRFRKFARRNKAMLATAGVIAVALLFGLIGTTSQWRRAESALASEAEQRELAQAAAKRAEDERNRARKAEEVATQDRDENRRFLYASDMIAAQQALATANFGRVLTLLRRHVPGSDIEQDLRGFQWYYLWKFCERGLRTPQFPGPKRGDVWTLAIAPNGKWLAAGTDDNGTVTLWDLATSKQLDTVVSGTTAVHRVAFSPDGTRLATTGFVRDGAGVVKLWEISDGVLSHVRDLPAADRVSSLAFSPDGNRLVWGTYSGSMHWWDTREQKEVKTHDSAHKGVIFAMEFSPDGRVLASGGADKAAKLWDGKTGEPQRSLDGHLNTVRDIAISPDGRVLASASWDTTVRVWDIESGSEVHQLTGHGAYVFAVAFSRDGTLASAGMDGQVRLWDVATGLESDNLIGHEQSVYALAWSPNGGTLVSGGADTAIKLWDMATKAPSTTIQADFPVTAVAVSRDGHTVAAAGSGGIKLWDVNASRKGFQPGPGSYEALTSVAFSPDGQVVASGGQDAIVRIWDVMNRTLLRELPGHPAGIWGLAYSHDGRYLASAGGKSEVRVWNAASGALESRDNQGGYFFSVAFSPRDDLLAAAGYEGVKLWGMRDGELTSLVHEVRTDEVVHSMAMSPDGEMLAFGTENGEVTLWDVSEQRELRSLAGHAGVVRSLAFCPRGKILASGSMDATIKLWYLDSDKEPETLIGHTSGVESLVFVNDHLLVSGSLDKTISFWRAATKDDVEGIDW